MTILASTLMLATAALLADAAATAPQWTQSFGGADDDAATDVRVDAAGDILVTGYEDRRLAPSSDTVARPRSLFVAKLDRAGTVRWRHALP